MKDEFTIDLEKFPNKIINVELDAFEQDLLGSMFQDRILKHREKARLEHAIGRVTDAELKWHEGHANYVESVAKKIFPEWHIPEDSDD